MRPIPRGPRQPPLPHDSPSRHRPAATRRRRAARLGASFGVWRPTVARRCPNPGAAGAEREPQGAHRRRGGQSRRCRGRHRQGARRYCCDLRGTHDHNRCHQSQQPPLPCSVAAGTLRADPSFAEVSPALDCGDEHKTPHPAAPAEPNIPAGPTPAPAPAPVRLPQRRSSALVGDSSHGLIGDRSSPG